MWINATIMFALVPATLPRVYGAVKDISDANVFLIEAILKIVFVMIIITGRGNQ